MSCEATEKSYEQLADRIISMWTIKDRDDLLDDCIEYIVEKFKEDGSIFYTAHSSVKKYFIEWLQHKVQISGVVSNQDLERMNKQRESNYA
jgi:thiamine biosynthesis protein ThiC